MQRNIYHDYIRNQLEDKKRDLDQKRESFDILVQNELYSGSADFEPTAIATLTSMARLKSEISLLENLQLVTTRISN